MKRYLIKYNKTKKRLVNASLFTKDIKKKENSMNSIEKFEMWYQSGFLTHKETEAMGVLKHSNDKLLEDSFYKDLEFGTGGLRGIIGLGTNRVNRFTIRRATQGIANYLNAIDSKHLKKQSLLMTQGIFQKNLH